MLPYISEIQRALDVTYGSQRPAPQQTGHALDTPSATLQVSETASSLLSAQAAAKASGGVRSDLVATLRQQIQSGRYTINGEKVVDGMVTQMLLDKLV